MLAAIFGHEEIVKLLLAAGADVNLMDSLGLTAADWAIRRGFPQLAQMVATTAAPIEQPNPPAENPAAVSGSLLSISGGNIQSETETASTPANQQEITARPKSGLLAVLRARAAAAAAAASETESLPPSATLEKSKGPAGDRSAQSEPAKTAFAETTTSRLDPNQTTGDQVQPLPTEVVLPALQPGSLPKSSSPLFAEVEVPTFAALSRTNSARPMLWVLITVTLVGAALITYRLTNRPPAQLAPSAPVLPKKVEEQPKATAARPGPLVAGKLAGAELSLPEADYSPKGNEAATGAVMVRVQVNRQGNVISTRVLNGPFPLRPAATKAARQATFAPERLSGGRVTTGTITYTFIEPAAASAASPTGAVAATEAAAVPNSTDDLPVTGDALAGTEIDLPRAEYPSSARKQGISGTITVRVRVNRSGRVVSWLTSKGDSRLRAAALKAARNARFAPDKLPGNGEVVGTITYNFKP